MRRSAAPSQLHAAKRARFTVPYKTDGASVLQCVQHQASSETSDAKLESVTNGRMSVTDTTHSSNSNTVSSQGLMQNCRKAFSPPSFRNRVPVGTAPELDSVLHKKNQTTLKYTESDIMVESASQLPVDEAQQSESMADSKGLFLKTIKTEAEDIQRNPVTDLLQTSSNSDNVDNKMRTPLKVCNVMKRFRTPLISHSAATSDCSQSVTVNENCSTRGLSQIPHVQQRRNDSMDSTSRDKCGYFSVVWCKLSKKKHKKWEGDAVLVTQGRHVTLYDMEGKEIGKSSGYKSSELESLMEDESLRVGGKEIQVMSKLSEELFKSGKCFSGAGSIAQHQPVLNKSICGLSKSFTNPVLAQKEDVTQIQNKTASASKVLSVTARFDPLAPNALVMPRPTTVHQFQHNKHQSSVIDVVVDPYLSNQLRPHQREGVTFLYECVTGMRNYGGTGAILADDMGLGKTLQCISLIWTLLKQGMYGGKPAAKKVLIITPGSLVKNWSAEFRKWLGPERLQVFAAAGDNRVEDYVKTAVYPVLIISYEMFIRGYEIIRKIPFDLVVCDEGHRLKNTAIKTTSMINSLSTRRRVVLTGTPIQNDLQEFFAVVDFCNPGILGSSAAFRRVYEEPMLTSRQPGASKDAVELGDERASELSRLTRMFVLRRTQEINNKYLPSKEELVLFCRPSHLQTELYHEILRSSAVRTCLMGKGFGAGLGAGSPHLLAIAALKQVCNHPKLIAPKVLKASQHLTEQGGADNISDADCLFSRLANRYQAQISSESLNLEASGKLVALSVILGNIFKSCPQDKVVLVSNHTKTLDLLQQLCTDHGYKYVRLDGHTPTAQRQQIVTRFNSDYAQERVFLLSSKAGGVGLNLVGASRLFLYDIDWNPANDLQAMARVWRDGQKKEVYIYRLLTTGTLEERVYQRQISKQGLSGAVMDLKASDIQFSQEDLKDLFSFNEGTDCDTHALLGCQCGNGENEKEAYSQSTSVTARPSQQGPAAQDKQTHNLSMAELLDWHHLKGSSQHMHKSWHLEDTEDFVSFLFWHRTNTANQSKSA